MNDGSLGMRFTSAADAALTAYAEALKACGAVLDYEFGTLIVRDTEVRQLDMTVAALTDGNIVHAAVKAADGIVTAEDGSITYTAAVINFTEENMGSALTARAYIKYTLIDGSVLYVYAAERTEGISLGELAQQCLADVSEESAEGYRNQVQEFYEVDEDGWYELIEEVAYSPYSKEQQAALKAIVETADL
jgi:phosphohistidine swiveling domain-containing protein